MSSIDRSSQTEPSALQISDPAVHDPKRRRSILITVSITLLAAMAMHRSLAFEVTA